MVKRKGNAEGVGKTAKGLLNPRHFVKFAIFELQISLYKLLNLIMV